MRDIRPVGKRKRGLPVPPGAEELPRQPVARAPQARAATVPVAKIAVAKQAPGKKPHTKRRKRSRRKEGAMGVLPQLRERERTIMLGLLALLVVIGLIAVLIFVPSAKIELILRTAPLLVDEEITVRAHSTGAPNVILGTAFFREVEVSEASPVTSTEVIGTIASGTVQIVNRSVDEQKLRERSRLITDDGQLFYVLDSVTLPAAEGGTLRRVNAQVEAAEAGEEGNIASGRLDFAALDEAGQALIYAEVVEPLTGGSGEVVSVVKESDLAAAREAAGEAARQAVEQDIREELPNGWVLLDESWTGEVLSFDTAIELDQREQSIPFTARLVVRVIGYEESALEQQLREALEQRVDSEYMLFPGSISYAKDVESIDWDAAEAVMNVRVTHTTIPELSIDALKDKLAGRSEEEAKQYLEGLPGVRATSIELSPFWVSAVPRIQGRIDIDLEPERKP